MPAVAAISAAKRCHGWRRVIFLLSDLITKNFGNFSSFKM